MTALETVRENAMTMNTYIFFSDDLRDRMKNGLHHLRGARSFEDRTRTVCDILGIYVDQRESRDAAQERACATLADEAVAFAARTPDIAGHLLATQVYADYTAHRRTALAA